MVARPRRSVLYMPGSNPKALAKARRPRRRRDHHRPRGFRRARRQGGGARVWPSRRCEAGGFGGREIVIRVNGAQTPWGAEDLAAAIAAAPDAILLPKVDGPGAIMVAARALREAGAPPNASPLGDDGDADGDPHAGSIAAAAADPEARLEVLVMGLNDLAKETRARLTPGRPAMTTWLVDSASPRRARTAATSSTASTTTSTTRSASRPNASRARDMGLDGKTLIHPNQIEICNADLRPTTAEVEIPQRAIIAAFALPENAGKGAIQLDGRMVELLHEEMARRTLAIAEGVAALAAGVA